MDSNRNVKRIGGTILIVSIMALIAYVMNSMFPVFVVKEGFTITDIIFLVGGVILVTSVLELLLPIITDIIMVRGYKYIERRILKEGSKSGMAQDELIELESFLEEILDIQYKIVGVSGHRAGNALLEAYESGLIDEVQAREVEQTLSLVKWIIELNTLGFDELIEYAKYGSGLAPGIRSVLERELERSETSEYKDQLQELLGVP